ncbi:MAG: lysylphosphatidylglycerol synthase transmembrane domain-containing protein, partial [Mariprofundaceae bacterium]
SYDCSAQGTLVFRIWNILYWLFLAAALLWCIPIVSDFLQEGTVTLSAGLLGMLFFIMLVGSVDLVIQNQAWACWLRSSAGHPRFLEGVWLTAACALANLIIPLRSGVALRLAYMRLQHQVRVGAMVMGVGVSYVMTLFVGVVLLLLALPGLSSAMTGSFNYAEVLGYLIIAIGLAAVGAFFLLSRNGKGEFSRISLFIDRLRADLGWVLERPGTIYRLFFWTVASAMIEVAVLYLAHMVLGISLGVQSLLWLAGMMTLSVFISVTPAGIGIQEGVLVALLALQGVAIDTGMQIALLRRMAPSVPVIIVGLPAWVWLSKALRQAWREASPHYS